MASRVLGFKHGRDRHTAHASPKLSLSPASSTPVNGSSMPPKSAVDIWDEGVERVRERQRSRQGPEARGCSCTAFHSGSRANLQQDMVAHNAQVAQQGFIGETTIQTALPQTWSQSDMASIYFTSGYQNECRSHPKAPAPSPASSDSNLRCSTPLDFANVFKDYRRADSAVTMTCQDNATDCSVPDKEQISTQSSNQIARSISPAPFITIEPISPSATSKPHTPTHGHGHTPATIQSLPRSHPAKYSRPATAQLRPENDGITWHTPIYNESSSPTGKRKPQQTLASGASMGASSLFSSTENPVTKPRTFSLDQSISYDPLFRPKTALVSWNEAGGERLRYGSYSDTLVREHELYYHDCNNNTSEQLRSLSYDDCFDDGNRLKSVFDHDDDDDRETRPFWTRIGQSIKEKKEERRTEKDPSTSRIGVIKERKQRSAGGLLGCWR
jgi:hypothetical protein